MPIPDEGLPQVDEIVDEEVGALEASAQDEADEDDLDSETADIDNNDDIVEIEEEADRDTASFGYGDPAD